MFKKKRKNEKNFGFTLIELVIAIAIVAIITGIVLANYWVGQRQQTLRAEAQKLASTLREAQNMTMAGRTYECTAGNPEPQNYGVLIWTNLWNNPIHTYWLAVDCNKDTNIDSNEISNHTLEKIDLKPKKITVSFSPPGLLKSFVFKRPEGSLATENDITQISLHLGSSSRTITVNKDTGQISLE